MSKNTKYSSYNQIIKEFDVYIMQVGKNQYQFKLIKRLDGHKPPRITLADIVERLDKIDQRINNLDKKLSNRIDNLEKIVVEDHNLLVKIIKLNNLKTK